MLHRICWLFPSGTGNQINSAATAAAAVKSLQSCPTLCDPIDGSPPGSPIPGILQARTLEWVAISFSNAWKWKVKVKSLSRVRPSVTPWTAAYQAPLSMGFFRQEYWSGVPLPSLINSAKPHLIEGDNKLGSSGKNTILEIYQSFDPTSATWKSLQVTWTLWDSISPPVLSTVGLSWTLNETTYIQLYINCICKG